MKAIGQQALGTIRLRLMIEDMMTYVPFHVIDASTNLILARTCQQPILTPFPGIANQNEYGSLLFETTLRTSFNSR